MGPFPHRNPRRIRLTRDELLLGLGRDLDGLLEGHWQGVSLRLLMIAGLAVDQNAVRLV